MPRRSSRSAWARAKGSVLNFMPLPDFGGHHPDPNLVHARALYDDDDGGRRARFRRRLRRRRRPQPHHRPAASSSPRPTASRCSPPMRIWRPATPRASPASPARCRRAAPPTVSPKSSASACYETPTGWKFFGNLLDAGMVTICGEESAGTGSNHVREKDGLWAVLLWLNILAVRKESVDRHRARALGDLRPQLLFAPRLRGSGFRRRQRPDGGPARHARRPAAARASAA